MRREKDEGDQNKTMLEIGVWMMGLEDRQSYEGVKLAKFPKP